ncbi:MAG TPA: ADP-ribosylation factor-like protein [Candidatus Lokiarchaeia archaeon]|nr:ADP-ribosylation factor-like protein [Candidatus Lokiarchaeia archaeon]
MERQSDSVESFKEFLERGKTAKKTKSYQEALSNFNIARKIMLNLRADGADVSQNDVETLESLFSEAKEGSEHEKKEREASQLTILRSKGPETPTSAKKLKTVSIFLFGLDAAGKTTFVDYVKQEKYLEHAPTLGVSISRIALGKVQFVFNDVGGQEAYRANWQNYWKSPDFLIFTIDSADAARFVQAKEYLWSVLNSANAKGLPLIVLSSKNDLPGARPIEEIKQALDLGNVIDRLVGIFDISVKEGQNVEKPLDFIASTVLTDQAMRKFVDGEISRLNRNYEDMYKAYIEESKELEKEQKYEKAINRLIKAKYIKEELFKQGFSKASKDIVKVDEWLTRLQPHAKK